jgi:hypothetical protein
VFIILIRIFCINSHIHNKNKKTNRRPHAALRVLEAARAQAEAVVVAGAGEGQESEAARALVFGVIERAIAR